MDRIITVCGEIKPEELGFTSLHEHTISESGHLTKALLGSMPAMIRGIRYNGGRDIEEERKRRQKEELKIPAMSLTGVMGSRKLRKGSPAAGLSNEDYYINELLEYKNSGGQTICDCTPLPIKGTSISEVRRLSEQSGIHIVSAAGFYIRALMDRETVKGGGAYMQARIEHMLDEGDGSCDGKPGFVKSAIGTVEDGDIHHLEQEAVLAGAREAARHGMSLHIHTQFPV